MICGFFLNPRQATLMIIPNFDNDFFIKITLKYV